MKADISILLASLLLATLPARVNAKDLTLEEAISIALTQNKETLASAESVRSAEYEAKASYGKLLPQIGLEGKYTVLNDPIVMDASSIRAAIVGSHQIAVQTEAALGNISAGNASTVLNTLNSKLPTMNLDIQEKSYANLSAVVTQPLFTGGKIWASISAKKEELGITQAFDKNTKNKIITEVVTSYYRIQMMKSLLAIRSELVKNLEERVSHADKLLKQGMISKANKMRADVALADAKREEFKSQKDLELSYILLANTLGTPSQDYNVTTPMFVSKVESLDEYLKLGLAHNPNLTILGHKSKQLDDKYTATRANFLPTFAAFGKYEIYKENLTLFEPEWAVGIMMKMNIFEGGSDYNSLQSVNSQKMALRYYEENARELVQTEIQKFYHDLKTAKEQIHALETNRALAEENLRLNRLSFEQGVATSLEVIDAELALGKVKTEQSKALFDYDVALVNLLRASGDCGNILSLPKENS